jgi:two-component system cell cycle sensor histidine kinase/response regulator CckA
LIPIAGFWPLLPGQKAIITSGFSESDRVLETQALGAGRYIKKPYRLEEIGMALREQLEGASGDDPSDPSSVN